MPSKLEQLQLQFRQRLKEERMIKIHTDNQQKALSKVSKYNGVLTTTTTTTQSVPKPPQPAIQPPSHHSPIKKGSPGVDRSRPLPPISKDSSRNSSSSRSSPTSPPSESAIVNKPAVGSRSVDLEPRQASPRPAVVPTRAPPRNGLASSSNRQPHTELRQPVQSQEPVVEKRPDPELLSRLKQAELQRLKANSRVREDVPSRNNGITSTARASNELRKAVKPSAPAPAPSRPRPKPQAAAPARRAAPSTSNKPPQRPTNRSAPPSSGVGRKPPGPGQSQCGVCGRNFNADRIEKHASICKKAAAKKVKVFDATKMRVKGTEAEQFVRKGVLTKAEPKPAKKSDWRKKHNDFIEAIRQAKMVQQHLAKGGKVSDLPPPPPSDTSDYVPCPHCGRKFNEAVAERHIPKCKNILSNKKNPAPTTRRR